MKTIKIIDLLNKIANGEEVPKEIKVNDNIYHYDETDCNEFYRYRTMANELLTDYADLNDEVEILGEEKKLPEKIGLIKYCEDQATSLIHHKVDEIIDYLDYLESKEKGE